MIIEKMRMHSKIVDAFLNTSVDNDLPVQITTGDRYTDYNGDRQIDVLLEFAEEDAELIHKSIDEVINETFCLTNNR